MNRRAKMIAVAAASLMLVGAPTAANACAWWGWDGGSHHSRPTPAPTPTEDPSPTPTQEPTPTEEPTEESAPVEDTTPSPAPSDDVTAQPAVQADSAATPPAASFVEDFNTPALLGQVSSLYKQAWQPYPDGTSGIYAPSKTVSVADGVMNVALGGAGSAGTFGTSAGAWGHVGGTFSVRAKAEGGDGNGAAFMLWPSSNNWSDGEIDFPEGNFESSPSGFQHSMVPGRGAEREQIGTNVSWRDWHTYTVNWVPGKSVTYSVDGTVLKTVTHDVPTTPHRFMFQTGNWGASGTLQIDWVSTTE
ncbi:hypothetical protein ASG04_02965 [Curtobacterium sp. Leaf183]|uniref:glycoside hydrolase family 16 protein n=1 Tax=Curtobacterium sp. Leaf183 TaxID=1736291 RepID=UPI0006F7F3BD|nr:glycoside hydrolase family 16 protein [Curtobacterium sp. Leaf183]KQS14798.1 hypothetical protein ASG04_02965 [Curtobacterium sp. Leaf183]